MRNTYIFKGILHCWNSKLCCLKQRNKTVHKPIIERGVGLPFHDKKATSSPFPGDLAEGGKTDVLGACHLFFITWTLSSKPCPSLTPVLPHTPLYPLYLYKLTHFNQSFQVLLIYSLYFISITFFSFGVFASDYDG